MRRPPVCLVLISLRVVLRALPALLVLSLVGFHLAVNRGVVRTTVPLPYLAAGKTVVIDAGHGGRDPGAVGRTGLSEKEITLDLAVRLRRLFSRAGIYVVMTRETDVDFGEMGGPSRGTKKSRDITYRVQKANQSGADLLLSIHVNSFPQSIWSGAQCFYDTVNPDSKQLAVAVQDELAARLGPNRRRPVAADYLILKATRMPSITVEVGFISNPREEKLLGEAEYRERLAEAIFAGAIAFFRQKRERSALSTVTRLEYPPAPPAAPSSGTAYLYFAAPGNSDMELWVEERKLPAAGETPARQACFVLEELFSGPGEGSVLLPCIPRGGWLRELRVNGRSAVVDLKEELAPVLNGGGAAELLAVYSIVNTLAANLQLEEVTLLVAGEEGGTLGGHFFFDEPLTPRPDLVGKGR